MRANKVGNNVLLLSYSPVRLLVLFYKSFVDLDLGLSHVCENPVGDVFRGNFQLTAYVVPAQLLEKLISAAAVREQVIETHAGAHEYLFHSGHTAQLPEELEIIAVVRLQTRTWFGIEALALRTGSALLLFFTGGQTKIRGRPADIVNVALELVVAHQLPRLPKQRLV